MKDVELVCPGNMPGDVGAELRIDLVEHVAPVIERPHLANRLVADTDDDPTDFAQHGIDPGTLVMPVLLAAWRFGGARELLALLAPIVHHVAEFLLMRHVVHARPHIDDWLECGMCRDIAHPHSVDPDRASVAERVAVFRSGTQHCRSHSQGFEHVGLL